jgi:hypothetical protein
MLLDATHYWTGKFTLLGGAGDGAFDEDGDCVCEGRVAPSGPLTDTLGISALTAALPTGGDMAPGLRAPGGT